MAGVILPIIATILLTYYLFRNNRTYDQQGQGAISDAQLDDQPISQAFSSGSANLVNVLKDLGIVGCTVKLSETQFEPVKCMANTSKHLLFMGILGSKWVNTHASEFENFLKRMEAKHGEVKFLLIDPKGRAYGTLYELREGKIKLDSLDKFYEFSKKYRCLRIKLYDDLPSFRLVLIDETTLGLSRYKLDRQGHFDSKFGWEAPHLIISSLSNWSLYWAFEHYYHRIWDSSKDLEDFVNQREEISYLIQ